MPKKLTYLEQTIDACTALPVDEASAALKAGARILKLRQKPKNEATPLGTPKRKRFKLQASEADGVPDNVEA